MVNSHCIQRVFRSSSNPSGPLVQSAVLQSPECFPIEAEAYLLTQHLFWIFPLCRLELSTCVLCGKLNPSMLNSSVCYWPATLLYFRYFLSDSQWANNAAFSYVTRIRRELCALTYISFFFPLFFPSARNDKQRMIYCSGHAYRLLFAVAANQWPITGMKSDGKAGFPLHALEYLPLGLVYWANLLKLIKTKASQRFQLLKQLRFFSWPLIFFTSSCKNIIDKSLSSRRNERKNPFYCLLICACTKEWRSRASW